MTLRNVRVLVQDLKKLDYGDVIEAASKIYKAVYILNCLSQEVSLLVPFASQSERKLVACIMRINIAFIDLQSMHGWQALR